MKPLTVEDGSLVVSRGDSEALLAAVASQTRNASAGIYGPESLSWRINREAALFLAAGRASLLQLAHPWVATALGHHSSLLAHPIARFHNTFRVVFTMVFGTLEQAVAAARHLHSLHTRIAGEMSEDVGMYSRGSHYQANEIAALRWVYATLIDSAVLAYGAALGPLTGTEREAYYAETKTLAALFGLPAAELPPNWEAFSIYNRAMTESNLLGVSDAARVIAQNLLAGAGSWMRPPQWYRSLTAFWLPERFRNEFALRFTRTEQHDAERALRRFPRRYHRLPAAIRFVGPYREAQARLSGRRIGVVTGLSNRFWIGEPRLPFH